MLRDGQILLPSVARAADGVICFLLFTSVPGQTRTSRHDCRASAPRKADIYDPSNAPEPYVHPPTIPAEVSSPSAFPGFTGCIRWSAAGIVSDC
jgi:hypothetical protein